MLPEPEYAEAIYSNDMNRFTWVKDYSPEDSNEYINKEITTFVRK